VFFHEESYVLKCPWAYTEKMSADAPNIGRIRVFSRDFYAYAQEHL